MAEKLPRKSRALACISARERRFLKRLRARQERAAAKVNPDDAPVRRVYSGWAD